LGSNSWMYVTLRSIWELAYGWLNVYFINKFGYLVKYSVYDFRTLLIVSG
jgi:hypothetical protein